MTEWTINMPKGSKQTPKPETLLLQLTAEQSALLQTAQGAMNQAQAALDVATEHRNILLSGILAGHHLTGGEVLRLTDKHELEVKV